MPPELYCHSVNKLLDLAHQYDLPLELLTAECKRMGLVIHDRYALTLDVAVKVKVDPKAISKHRKGKRLRLKLDSFLTFDDLTAEQTSNLRGYFNFDKAPTDTYRDIDRRALTRFNSKRLDRRVRVGNGLYSSLDIAKFLSYAKTSEFDLHYSIYLRDPPLGMRAGDKKAIILPLKITGTDAQKAIDETPTLQRLLDTFDINQRINVYIQKPFPFKKYCESKKAAKNITPSLANKPEGIQLNIFGIPAFSSRGFSLRGWTMRKRSNPHLFG